MYLPPKKKLLISEGSGSSTILLTDHRLQVLALEDEMLSMMVLQGLL